MAAEKYDWRAKMQKAADTAKPAAKREKYDWRSKIKEATETAEPEAKAESHDWRSKIKDAVGLARPSPEDGRGSDWRFRRTIAGAIRVVKAEQEAQREREAAERARLAKARNRASMVHEKVILPLFNRLLDDFAAHPKKVLPVWDVRSKNDADRFSAEAATPSIETGAAKRFAIEAEASVTELGEFVTLSVACSMIDPKIASPGHVASLFEKKAKFPAVQIFDELGSRTWFHTQLAECVRLCVLTGIRDSNKTQSSISA
jgi:hypothetical protein